MTADFHNILRVTWHFSANRRSARIGLATMGLMLAGAPVAALAWQATPQIPTREELQPPAPTTAPTQSGQILTADDSIERAPCPLANPEFANVSITLKGVEFTSPDGIDASILTSSWSDKQGQTLPISVVCDIRDRAATLLRSKGYLAAVRVPPQTIDDGIIRLDILAARLTRIEVRGDAGRSEKLLQAYLSKIEGQPIFNITDAERYLLLARDIPGLDARLTLRPSGTPGEVVGEVEVSRTPLVLDANIQNFGPRDVGRFGGIARARINGLTGLGDMTTLSTIRPPTSRNSKLFRRPMNFGSGAKA